MINPDEKGNKATQDVGATGTSPLTQDTTPATSSSANGAGAPNPSSQALNNFGAGTGYVNLSSYLGANNQGNRQNLVTQAGATATGDEAAKFKTAVDSNNAGAGDANAALKSVSAGDVNQAAANATGKSGIVGGTVDGTGSQAAVIGGTAITQQAGSDPKTAYPALSGLLNQQDAGPTSFTYSTDAADAAKIKELGDTSTVARAAGGAGATGFDSAMFGADSGVQSAMTAVKGKYDAQNTADKTAADAANANDKAIAKKYTDQNAASQGYYDNYMHGPQYAPAQPRAGGVPARSSAAVDAEKAKQAQARINTNTAINPNTGLPVDVGGGNNLRGKQRGSGNGGGV